jgi:hypothetical protein
MFRLKPASSIAFHSLFRSPWLYFSIFSVANTVLAYVESTNQTLLVTTSFCLFFFILLALFFLLKNGHSENPLYLKETILTLSSQWFYTILFLALLPRLYILFNSAWPISDDGLSTFNSIELSKKWIWRFFFTHGQTPPINFWIEGLYFNLIVPSIFSMRFFYSMLSILAVILTFIFSKNHFSRSMTFFILVFSALSFPSLYTTRFDFYAQTLFTFQIIALGFLLNYLDSTSSLRYQKNAWKLGLITGLGFWVAIQWPLAAFTITIAVFLTEKTKKIKTILSKNTPFWLALSLFSVPFLAVSFLFKNGDHIKHLLDTPPAEGVSRLSSFFSNWTSLFWGCNIQNSYGPVWGGMLNPVAGSLFFIGIIELLRYHKFGLSRWILFSFLIFMIPGFITPSFDIFRNSLIFPLLIFICALGLQSLCQNTSPQLKSISLILVLLFSTSLDINHLWKTYQPCSSAGSNYSSNTSQFSKAFSLLKETEKQKGFGDFLGGLDIDLSDRTLDVATYPFNAAENPNLSAKNVQWVAFITNANYKPFLFERYPQANFYWLGPDTFWNQGGLMLVVIFKDNKNENVLKHWSDVNYQFQSVTRDLFLDPLNHQDEHFHKFLEIETLTKDDRFLESIFYEKYAYFQRDNPNKDQLINLLKLATKKGYPAAHLFATEGLLWRAEGNYTEAGKAFKKAIHSQLNLTDAQKNLETLSLLKKIL